MTSLQIPPHEVMQAMSNLALETAMQQLADQAEQFAADPQMRLLNGRDALLAFARAIRSTNAKVWPGKGQPA